MLAKGDHEKALEAFRSAAAADPGFLEAAVMTARVSLAFGSLAEAEHLARQVSPEVINRGDLRYLLGGLMLAKGDQDAAGGCVPRAAGAAPRRRAGGSGGSARRLSRAGIAPGPSRLSGRPARCNPRTRKGRRSCGGIFATAASAGNRSEEEGFCDDLSFSRRVNERYCKLFTPSPPAPAAP